MRLDIQSIQCQYCGRHIDPEKDENGDIWFVCPLYNTEEFDFEKHTFLLYSKKDKKLC